MEGTASALNWRKSSFSGGNGGQCVESASAPGRVLVRDTADRAGTVLTFTPQAWQEFAATLKHAG
jgi:hypothetical protein